MFPEQIGVPMATHQSSQMQRLAVLIDADNTSPKIIEPLLREVAKYGTANVKRIYGDWTNHQLYSWKDKLHKFAIQPIQQFTYTIGKNATDSALIIDAMDLLYSQNFDGFCIVSSDSDFTRLAARLRESGQVVYGFGQQKTPEAFVEACDKFIYTEILQEDADHSSHGKQVTTAQTNPFDQKLARLLKDAYEATADEEGWSNLGPFGSQLTKLSPSFDARNYGYKKLSELVQASQWFEIRRANKRFMVQFKATP
jgi:uncharacterized LabA/DUF88 family protein